MPATSASLGLPNEKISSLNGNHLEIAKYRTKEDNNYTRVSGNIAKMVAKLTKPLASNISNERITSTTASSVAPVHSVTPEASQSLPTTRRILTIDGGGMRALSSLVILREIMEEIGARRTPSNTSKPCECFDLIGGTGTGGWIAVMLGLLGMVIYLFLKSSFWRL